MTIFSLICNNQINRTMQSRGKERKFLLNTFRMMEVSIFSTKVQVKEERIKCPKDFSYNFNNRKVMDYVSKQIKRTNCPYFMGYN